MLQYLYLIFQYLVVIIRYNWKVIGSIYYLIRRYGLWVLVILVFSIIPSLMGSYSYLTSLGLPWYHAMYSAISVQFGGALFTAFYTFVELMKVGFGSPAAVPLIVGLVNTVLGVVWYVVIWFRLNRFFARTVNAFWIMFIGAIIVTTMFANTMLIDAWVLPDEDLRVAGSAYFIENPEESTAPFSYAIDKYILKNPNATYNATIPTNMTGNQTRFDTSWSDSSIINGTQQTNATFSSELGKVKNLMWFLGQGDN